MKTAVISAIFLIGCATSASAWSDAVHKRVVRLASRIMPPALATQLERMDATLIAGATAPDQSGEPSEHALHADGSGGDLDQQVAAAVGRAVQILRSRGQFEDFVREMGLISHLVSDAAFPLNTSATDGREAQYYADYAAYAEAKLGKFRPVFNGYADMDHGFDVAQHVRTIAARANRGYGFVGHGYFPEGASRMRSSSSFDDRGPVFGVTQLAFVNAVSATANVWLYTWRMAHGDIEGTPYYRSREGSSDADDSSRTAKRP